MNKSTLSKYSNSELVQALSSGRKLERETSAEVILLLSELDRRKLYRDEGYPSLFAVSYTHLTLPTTYTV